MNIQNLCVVAKNSLKGARRHIKERAVKRKKEERGALKTYNACKISYTDFYSANPKCSYFIKKLNNLTKDLESKPSISEINSETFKLIYDKLNELREIFRKNNKNDYYKDMWGCNFDECVKNAFEEGLGLAKKEEDNYFNELKSAKIENWPEIGNDSQNKEAGKVRGEAITNIFKFTVSIFEFLRKKSKIIINSKLDESVKESLKDTKNLSTKIDEIYKKINENVIATLKDRKVRYILKDSNSGDHSNSGDQFIKNLENSLKEYDDLVEKIKNEKTGVRKYYNMIGFKMDLIMPLNAFRKELKKILNNIKNPSSSKKIPR